jgi:hypothetical protein
LGQLNIKDDALIAEAKALAEEMGTSVTGVLREGVRALREQRQRDAEGDRFVEELLEIGRRVRATLPPGATSDHADLYDDDGLPR